MQESDRDAGAPTSASGVLIANALRHFQKAVSTFSAAVVGRLAQITGAFFDCGAVGALDRGSWGKVLTAYPIADYEGHLFIAANRRPALKGNQEEGGGGGEGDRVKLEHFDGKGERAGLEEERDAKKVKDFEEWLGKYRKE